MARTRFKVKEGISVADDNSPSGYSLIPAGTVVAFAGSSAPEGWLICDGSAVSRTTYANLWAVISSTYGSGDGSTTFNLPDAQGRSLVGAGSGSGLTARTLSTKSGAETSTIDSANLPTHTHAIDHDHGSVTSSSENADHVHGIDPPNTGSSFVSSDHAHYTGSHNHTYLFSTDVASGTNRARLTASGGSTASGGINAADAGWSGGISANHTHTMDIGAFNSGGISANHQHTVDLPNFTGNSGNGGFANTPLSVMHPFLVLNYIIKY